MLELADATIADEFARESKIAVAALLTANLNDALFVPHRFHKTLAFVDGQRERLLGINIFAGLHREQVYEGMPVIGRTGDDRVDIVPLHQFSKILVLFGHFAALGELLGRDLSMGVVHIAHGNDVAKIGCASAIAATLPAAPDQSDAGAVIRSERLRLRGICFFEFEIPSRHAGDGGDGSGGLEKTTAIDVKDMWFHEWIGIPLPACVKREQFGSSSIAVRRQGGNIFFPEFQLDIQFQKFSGAQFGEAGHDPFSI
jgi:hypothetical protein